jgi:hypothetical protein
MPKKTTQQFISDYASRAIENGMDPAEAWAEAHQMADRAIRLGHISANPEEEEGAMKRERARRRSEFSERAIPAVAAPEAVAALAVGEAWRGGGMPDPYDISPTDVARRLKSDYDARQRRDIERGKGGRSRAPEPFHSLDPERQWYTAELVNSDRSEPRAVYDQYGKRMSKAEQDEAQAHAYRLWDEELRAKGDRSKARRSEPSSRMLDTWERMDRMDRLPMSTPHPIRESAESKAMRSLDLVPPSMVEIDRAMNSGMMDYVLPAEERGGLDPRPGDEVEETFIRRYRAPQE